MDNSDDIFGPIDPTSVRVYDTIDDLTIDKSSATLQDEDLLIAESFFSDLGALGTPYALATISKN
jgi:hypothetical protein